MAWVWMNPKEDDQWGADFDLQASRPMNGTECLGDKWIDPSIYKPVFRSKSGLKRFKAMHCPPMGSYIAVDAVWKEIILNFVREDRIQFLPIRLVARGEVCDDYFCPIIFDTVFCIDTEKSRITQKRQNGDQLYIYRVSEFVHIPGCLGGFNLARDRRMSRHIILSDALKEALAATGEDSMFYRPEDIVTFDRK